MSLLLFLLYPLAVQYNRGGAWRLLFPVTLVAFLLDILANYTELAILTGDFPREGEYTFSQRCKRMKLQDTWGGKVARFIEPYLDYFDPSGDHI